MNMVVMSVWRHHEYTNGTLATIEWRMENAWWGKRALIRSIQRVNMGDTREPQMSIHGLHGWKMHGRGRARIDISIHMRT